MTSKSRTSARRRTTAKSPMLQCSVQNDGTRYSTERGGRHLRMPCVLSCRPWWVRRLQRSWEHPQLNRTFSINGLLYPPEGVVVFVLLRTLFSAWTTFAAPAARHTEGLPRQGAARLRTRSEERRVGKEGRSR